MSGTREGGLKSSKKIMDREPDFFKRIGSKGGTISRGGGFASENSCFCDYGNIKFGVGHNLARCAGAKGGEISKRRKKQV